jgi:stage V sporulation protein AC
LNKTNEEYKKYADKHAKPSPIILNCIKAFIVGGIICCIGQLLFLLYQAAGMNELNARSLVSVTLIFIAVFLTGLHVFDDIAKFGGAGTLVPITGFANAVVSPAIEFKSEGFVLGVGANMFKIAGPVIVYGTIASVVYGVIYWVCTIM